MNNEIMPFNYKGTSVRTIQVGADPFFVLPDICKVLGLTNPSKVANQIDPDALTTSEVIDSMGRNQRVNVVNEAGLYEVIFMSRKAEVSPSGLSNSGCSRASRSRRSISATISLSVACSNVILESCFSTSSRVRNPWMMRASRMSSLKARAIATTSSGSSRPLRSCRLRVDWLIPAIPATALTECDPATRSYHFAMFIGTIIPTLVKLQKNLGELIDKRLEV